MKPNIAFIDIESSPLNILAWGTYEQNAIKVLKTWRLLTFAVKWNDGKVSVYHDDEEKLVKMLWDVFEKADIIVAHNGDRFDIKKAKTKFVQYSLPVPSPYKTVDTLKVARKFGFDSNKLDSLGEYLGLGGKMKHEGIDLWLGVMDGDKKSISTMKRYNKRDVELLYQVYQKLLPWIENHPNIAVYEEVDGCPNCGSSLFQSRGFSITSKGKKRRFQCQDCGKWFHGPSHKVIETS
jgi:uncharacterized protein YprB with RNaseH-like and TPR domain